MIAQSRNRRRADVVAAGDVGKRLALLAAWARAKAGEGQIVLVSGEPGIGKSRLLAVFEQRLEGEPHIRLHFFCSPHHQDSVFQR